MSFLNRLVMILIALLLIVLPVLLLLISYGMVQAAYINAYLGYRDAFKALGALTIADFSTRVRVITGIASGLVALTALRLLLREVALGRRVARHAVIQDTPGQEVLITASAVRRLAEGAAKEAGAVSPAAYLTSKGSYYEVECNILAPRSRNIASLASAVRNNILKVLESQGVPVKDAEVTVRGTAHGERSQLR